MADFRTLQYALTKADYDRLVASGEITRPLGWGGRGVSSATPRLAAGTVVNGGPPKFLPVARRSERPHGTRAKYVAERCRCDECTAANRAYARALEREKRRVAYGIEAPKVRVIDAGEARAHIEWLRSQGVGMRRISEVSGIAKSALTKMLVDGARAHVSTINAVLAVPKTAIANGSRVDASRAAALVADLRYLGFRRRHIAREMGLNDIPVLKQSISKRTDDRIKALHDRLLATLPQWHGTYYGYAKRRCRCLRCKEAASQYSKERRAR